MFKKSTYDIKNCTNTNIIHNIDILWRYGEPKIKFPTDSGKKH